MVTESGAWCEIERATFYRLTPAQYQRLDTGDYVDEGETAKVIEGAQSVSPRSIPWPDLG